MEWLIFGFIGLAIYYFIKETILGKKISYIDQGGNQKTERLKRRQSRQILKIDKLDNFEIILEIKNILDNLENTSSNFFLS